MGHDIVDFIERATALGYEISMVDAETKQENNMKFTTEQINTITNATAFYQVEQVLAEVFDVETYKVSSLMKEPYLADLVEDKTFDGIETKIPFHDIIQTVNRVYGNLCYLSHYDQEGKGDKTTAEYENIWGELLKKIANKVTRGVEYWNLGDAGLEKFTPFENKDEMLAFVHTAYEKAVDLENSVDGLAMMANRLCSEYYTNDELLDKAGEKALGLATAFEDYATICYNENQERHFPQAIIDQAIEQAVALKEEATEEELESLIELLADDEEFDNIKKLDPNWTPPPPIENIEIKISGRIPEYYFGSVKDEYIEVFEKAIEHANENMDTMQTFLEALLKTTLEDKKEDMEIFKVDLDMETVKEDCPKLIELLKQIEEEEMSHYDLYDEILDVPYEPRVIFIEDDARITITKNWGEDEVLAEQKLSEFLGEEKDKDLTEDENEAIKNQVTELYEAQNHEFTFAGDVEEFSVFQSAKKTLTISNWIKPDDLTSDDFLEKEHDVMIIHDDIVDYTFDISTANFDLSKITFLQFASADEIRQSAAELVANYLFYENEHISPDKNWHRDKGIELRYQPKHEGLSALLEG